MLLTRIWGDSAYRDPRTIDVHIRHLREKLERDAKEPEYLFTVRGVGYRFRDTANVARRDPLRSLTLRLALLFCAITLGGDRAASTSYVVPLAGVEPARPEARTTRARRPSATAGRCAARSTPSQSAGAIDGRVRRAADAAGARVTLLAVTRGTEGPRLDLRSRTPRPRSTSPTCSSPSPTARPLRPDRARDRGGRHRPRGRGRDPAAVTPAARSGRGSTTSRSSPRR